MLGKYLDFYLITVGKWVILGGAILALVGLYVAFFSNQFFDVGYAPKQPIAYSHKLHAGDMNISCFYCHGPAEKTANATIPATQICMNCHSTVKRNSPEVQKIVASYENNTPIEWIRVHKLADFVHFKHNVHIKAGVSCFDCHGKIYEMDVVRQEKPLNMGWCLDCHRKKLDLALSPRIEDAIEKSSKDEEFYKKLMEGKTPYKGVHWLEKHQLKMGPQHCSACHF